VKQDSIAQSKFETRNSKLEGNPKPKSEARVCCAVRASNLEFLRVSVFDFRVFTLPPRSQSVHQKVDGLLRIPRIAHVVRHQQMVAPSACNSRNNAITASPFFESRFPVGSSASRSRAGRRAPGPRPRVVAGRRKAAPDNVSPRRHADLGERLVHALAAFDLGQAAVGQRQFDVLHTVRSPMRLKLWK